MLGLVMLVAAPSVGRIPLVRQASYVYNQTSWQRGPRGWAALVPTAPLILMHWFQPTELYRAWTCEGTTTPLLNDLRFRLGWGSAELRVWHTDLFRIAVDGRARPVSGANAGAASVRFVPVSEITRADGWETDDPPMGFDLRALVGRFPEHPYLDHPVANDRCEEITMLACCAWDDFGRRPIEGRARVRPFFGDYLACEGPNGLLDEIQRFVMAIERAERTPVRVPGCDDLRMVCVRSSHEELNETQNSVIDTANLLWRDERVERGDWNLYGLGSRTMVVCDRDDEDEMMKLIRRARPGNEGGITLSLPE
jgi:hypothetical protein